MWHQVSAAEIGLTGRPSQRPATRRRSIEFYDDLGTVLGPQLRPGTRRAPVAASTGARPVDGYFVVIAIFLGSGWAFSGTVTSRIPSL